MRFWWVNHKQTFQQEFAGQYVWCPKQKRNGQRNHFYETVREVTPGDLVFSYAFAALQGFGFARTHCYSCPRPDEFGKVGDSWDHRGWRVDVGFQAFNAPLRVADHASLLVDLLPRTYSPITADGFGNQGAYFAEISNGLATTLASMVNPPIAAFLENRVSEQSLPALDLELPLLMEWEDRQQEQIENRNGLSSTERKALILSRRGQGLFRQRVSEYEAFCRITKVENPSHLIASHIKPWRESNDNERLEAANGLLLTPSIDHLFDRGFISFSDQGDVIVSPIADHLSLKRMGLDADKQTHVGKFSSDQCYFLDYHRKEILLKSAA